MLDFFTFNQLVVSGFFLVFFLMYHRAPFWLFSVLGISVLYSVSIPTQLFTTVLVIGVILNIPFIRRYLFSYPVFFTMKVLNFLPAISQTEKDAIESGTVWMDAELFSGKPNFNTILDQPYPELSDEEQAFLDGPTERLCVAVDHWDVYQQRDFSDEIWEVFKKERFFGLIIPKQYGGLGFSAIANSAIVAKCGSRSTPLGITVMVPNSLGPAELLIHYGTQSQKDYYLPRLAIGEEIPCFALTEPNAGSDAGAMTSQGIVFKGSDHVLYIKLHWNKRYITLASKATLLGLAFKLYDPENFLGKGTDLGITCALIPVSTPGIVVGKRHDPLGVPFYNCPTHGTDVVVPLSAVIGEESGVGKGWKMLMECLAAGRGISLPANCSGGAKLATRVVGAYSMIRKQFGIEIGKFEGIQEPLSFIAGSTYLLDAIRKYTCGGIDAGAKPAVVTAITKYHATHLFQQLITRAMDIVGGAGISMGPRNLLGHAYIAAPIGVTVEGANILTRTLMIFGQGAIRCHPYALEEIYAIETNDIARFDKAFWGHQGHIISNFVRMTFLGITRGLLVFPARFGAAARYYQRLTWVSATFAFYTDMAMVLFGGSLKRKECITGRYGDILSWMYIGAAVLRRFEAEGRRKEDLPYLHWTMQYAFDRIQQAFTLLFKNMGPLFILARLFTYLFPIGSAPSDHISHQVASSIQKPGPQRDRLTEGIFLSNNRADAIGRIDYAFKTIYDSRHIYKKIHQAIREKQLKKTDIRSMISSALDANIISKEESCRLIESEDLRDDVIAVDSFTQEEYMQSSVKKVQNIC